MKKGLIKVLIAKILYITKILLNLRDHEILYIVAISYKENNKDNNIHFWGNKFKEIYM